MKKTTYIAIIILGLIIGIIVAKGIQAFQYSFTNQGNIEAVGVALTWLNDGTPVTDVNWGNVPDNVATTLEPIKITNIKTLPCTLSLKTEEPSQSITTLSLTWNYAGTTLQPTESVTVELTQTITATGSWTYKTTITATEV